MIITKQKCRQGRYRYILGLEKDARDALKAGDPILANILWKNVRFLRKNLKDLYREYRAFKKDPSRLIMPIPYSSELVFAKKGV